LYGVTPDQFLEAVKGASDDAGVQARLEQIGRKPSAEDIKQHNETVFAAGPRDDEAMGRFRANLTKLGFGDRTDVKTHVDAEDLEEGREVARRS
jgi:hypothetical protein